MRRVLHEDVIGLARAALGMPEAARRRYVRRTLERADFAHGYFRRTSAPHPLFGDGSIGAVIPGSLRHREPALDDVCYCGCLAMVFDELLCWLTRNPDSAQSRS